MYNSSCSFNFIHLYFILRNDLQDERDLCEFGDCSFAKFKFCYLLTYKIATGKGNIITTGREENRRPQRIISMQIKVGRGGGLQNVEK